MDREEVRAVYRLRVPAENAPRRAQVLALEQSIEMPAEAVLDAGVLERIAARVERIDALPDGSSLAQIALAVESVGADAGQLLNMLFGNSSLLPDVELIDVDVPDALARRFGGPALGIEGLRGLVGVTGRPLTCTALKPIGSTPGQLAVLCRTFAAAGIDVIKDDHGWADQAAAPFAQRVAACQAAVDEANARRGGGPVTLYAPSLFGTCTQMLRQIELARARGVRIALIAPMVCGASTLNGLRREHPDFAFIAHPSLAGASRIAPAALLGRLFRLFGADATIFPNHGGRFTYPREACLAIAQANRCAWHGLKPALPVPAGGMSVERVPELKREYGDDCMLLIGGSLLMAREKLYERSCEFVEAVARARTPADA
ncbi:MAG: RuBisCO large subunit C-terminal-like domain-containing protein [Burkholderiaceae bacterium]|nr:RuBisCO large subunit C-terminal-like domain-containing protein [Burkholderiaceae bacterium]